MKTKLQQAIVAGIIATTAMSIIMFITPIIGIPKISPPEMLSKMIGFSIYMGWIMHFMIGITFSTVYAFIFIKLIKKIKNNILRGIIFGFSVFIFAQIAIAIIGWMMGEMPPMQGSMMMTVIGSIIGHLVFGIVVALFVKEQE